MTTPWHAVEQQLDRARDEGRAFRIWLRDDDAVGVTAPLDHLRELCAKVGMPVLLAVIPAEVDGKLAPWIDETPSFTPCQHGYAHTNHAGAGARACELGTDRPRVEVLAELARGRLRLRDLFGPRLADILVPPWNRIDPGLIPFLPDLEFRALSTFGAPGAVSVQTESRSDPSSDETARFSEPERFSQRRNRSGSHLIREINCDLDIIDWRNGRVGRSFEDLCGKLAAVLDRSHAPDRLVGILTHHLAHDARAWAGLAEILERLSAHPAAQFTGAATWLD